MRAYERLLQYVKTDTQSAEDQASTPSTGGQLELAKELASELRAIGLERVYLDEHGYVYGFIPPSAAGSELPTIGLIAHLDTATDFPGGNVHARVIDNYDGADIILGESGLVMESSRFPELAELKGQTLIVTDGTSLLGADDKAGIAEIMTACERLLRESREHCGVAVCFTPDEEIGHGAALLDIGRLGADFAYTLDGNALNEINYETFNASSATMDIRGVSVHPGSAKGLMVNAGLVAMEISSLLPAKETPSATEGYQGFFHLTDISGNVEHSQLKYIIRDHELSALEKRCSLLQDITRRMNEKYGADTVRLTVKPQYKNMAQILEKRMEIVERARRAIASVGLSPVTAPVRGGTDGSQLSFRGLPCPNLGTGCRNIHGPYEHISAEQMDTAVDIILNLLTQSR